MTDDPFSSRLAGSTPRKKSKTPARIALVIGAIIAVIWSAAQTLSSIGSDRNAPPDPSETAAYSLGESIGGVLGAGLFIGGLIWLVVYFAFVKPSGHRNGTKYFLVLAMAAMLGAAPFRFVELSAGGLSARVDSITAEYRAEMKADDEAYFEELKATGFEARLGTFGRMATDPVAAEATAAKALAVAEKYRSIDAARGPKVRARLAALELTGSQRQDLLGGFDSGYNAKRPLVEDVWRLEIEAIKNLLEGARILKRARGRFTVDGDNVMFNRQSDLNAFQAIVLRHRTLEMEQQVAKLRLNTPAPRREEAQRP